MMMALIPWYYKALAGLALCAALVTGEQLWESHLIGIGRAEIQANWDKKDADDALRVAFIKAEKADDVTNVVIKYTDRVQIITEKAKIRIKEVPIYVPKDADDKCVVNVGFVRLHDTAATTTSQLDATPGKSYADPSGVALSTVGTIVTENYDICHKNAEQLIGLQEYVLVQTGTANNTKKDIP